MFLHSNWNKLQLTNKNAFGTPLPPMFGKYRIYSKAALESERTIKSIVKHISK